MDGTTPFAIRIERGPAGQTVLAVAGDLDLATAERLREQLNTVPGGSVVVLDLKKVEFCDSAGLRVLLDAELRTRVGGGELRLAAPSAALVRLFELTGVDGFIRVFATIGDAFAR